MYSKSIPIGTYLYLVHWICIYNYNIVTIYYICSQLLSNCEIYLQYLSYLIYFSPFLYLYGMTESKSQKQIPNQQKLRARFSLLFYLKEKGLSRNSYEPQKKYFFNFCKGFLRAGTNRACDNQSHYIEVAQGAGKCLQKRKTKLIVNIYPIFTPQFFFQKSKKK